MRFWQWLLMIIGWWAGGFLLSSFIIRCRIVMALPPDGAFPKVDPGCPIPSYKCWVGGFVALAFGVAWTFAMGWKPPVPVFDYFASVAVSSIVGASIARILCPK